MATAVSKDNAEITAKDSNGTYTETIYIKVLNDILVGDTVRLYLVDDPSTTALL